MFSLHRVWGGMGILKILEMGWSIYVVPAQIRQENSSDMTAHLLQLQLQLFLLFQF